MIEAETKYRSPGNEKIEKTLSHLGATKVSEGVQEDIYFSHPAREFQETDEALRIRKKEDGAELTYKGPRMKLEHTKAREEITLKTSDPLAVQRIVERLGFKEFHVVKKTRSTYILDKLRIEVDNVEGLGEFVELEVITESPERAAKLIDLAKEELGLDRPEKKTYLEMLLERKSSQKSQS